MREHLLNADFDLSLRPRWRGLGGVRAERVRELALHGMLIADRGDSVIVPSPLPPAFLDHFERKGLTVPTLTVSPTIRSQARLVPFGWNEAAAELNRHYAEPAPHPPLDVVRRVNSRCFAAALERDLFDQPFNLGEFTAVAELENLLHDQPDRAHGWIVKSEHGNAGLGNRRVRSRSLQPTDRRFVAALLEEDDLVLLEPWQPRCLDLCCTFTVSVAGEVADLHVHEVINTADGAFIGALFEPISATIERWRPGIASAALRVASQLHGEGYFGPVCVDGMVFSEGGRKRLRPLVDLNARSHISAAALRLWRHWEQRRTVYWRFFSSRKLVLPTDYDGLERILGDDDFDPERARGTLLVSPLSLDRDGRPGPPHKLGLLFAGGSRDEVRNLERSFRKRFER